MGKALGFLFTLLLTAVVAYHSGSLAAEERLEEEMKSLRIIAESQQEAATIAREDLCLVTEAHEALLEEVNRPPAVVPQEVSVASEDKKEAADRSDAGAGPNRDLYHVDIDKSASKQALRKDALQDLTQQGILKSHEKVSAARVVAIVTPLFGTLDFDFKESMSKVLYTYHFNGTEDFGGRVEFRDSKTDKRVATYSLIRGLSVE